MHMDRKQQICDLYAIDPSELDLKIVQFQSITEEKDLSILLDCLCESDLDASKAIQIYFDKSASQNDTKPPKQSNDSDQKSNSSSFSLIQQFQNKFSLNLSNIIGINKEEEKKEESILRSDHSSIYIECTPLNNFTTLQSLVTHKNVMRAPDGHLSCKHDGPWNKFYIELVENKDILYSLNLNDTIITIKLLMNDFTEYLCVRFNKKIGTTFKSNIIFAHWKLIVINKSKNIVAFQSMSSPNLAFCIDGNNDYKPSMYNFGDNIYPLHTNIMYQFEYKHHKNSIISSWIRDCAADKMSLHFVNTFAFKMNKYQQYGLPNINGRILTETEKLHFIQHGFVIIRNAINEELYNEAISWINNGLGHGSHINMRDINGAWICKEKQILNLYFKSNLYSLVRSILHENPRDNNNNYDVIVPAAQIALNFPLNDNIKKYWNKQQSIKHNGWHIDGMDVKNDNTQIAGFSLLCGCILSYWSHDYMGNFTLWDKSHYNLGNLIKNSGEHEFLAKEGFHENRSNLGNEIIQIKGNIGDIIICHPYLAHLRGPNFSNNIRYAVFIRPYVMNHAAFYTQLLEKDMFAEYKGLKHLIETKKQNINTMTATIHNNGGYDDDNNDNMKNKIKSIFE